MTKFYQFIIDIQDEDSSFGDLAKAMLQDEDFPVNATEEAQMVYLNNIKPYLLPHVQTEIEKFFECYNVYNKEYGK